MKFSLVDRFRYEFDNTMAKGVIALIAWLFLVSAGLILLISLLITLTGIAPAAGDSSPGYWQITWLSLMRTLDAGTMGGDEGGWPYLLAMLAVTLGGVFLVSTLIGILTSGIESKLDELRKGRSQVVENGHTVILGWTPQIFSILSELITANQNQRRACIAILADKDKVEMEDEIRHKTGPTGRTQIVCRTGDPLELTDLAIVSPHTSRSIIILSPEANDPDTQVIKTILALTNHPERRPDPHHIVAEIHSPHNVEVARMVGQGEVELVTSGNLIAQITAQTCRQSGLSIVYTELLDFGGDEIYFHEEPALVGQTFGQALTAYPDSTPIGLRFAGGRVQLKPPMDTLIQPGDQVIAISEDDDTLRISTTPRPPILESLLHHPQPAASQPERTLILGWNQRGPVILHELETYVAPGSEACVVADLPAVGQILAELSQAFQNQRLEFCLGDTTDRKTLEMLRIPGFNHVIVLSYSDHLETQAADSKTLLTLLHLRSIAEITGHPFSIVSEMLDIRNRKLAEVTHADDFIVSDQLISLMLAQISENKDLAPVFGALLDPEGAELYLKPAADYVAPGQVVDFYTVVEAARRRGEVAVGYRLGFESGNAALSLGVHINPTKGEGIIFQDCDRIVVLADQ